MARSYARLTNRPLSAWELSDTERRAWSTLIPLISDLRYPIDGYDLMAALWAGPVLRYLDTYPQGIWRGALNYADLLNDRVAVFEALAGDLQLGPGIAGLPATVFDAHSQTGSHLAPERLDFDPVLEGELASPEFSNRIARSLHRIDRRLHSEMVLPGAFPDASAITL